MEIEIKAVQVFNTEIKDYNVMYEVHIGTSLIGCFERDNLIRLLELITIKPLLPQLPKPLK